MTILINTPNGNIGRGAAERLLDAGHRLTVISRSAEKAAPLAARGARVVEGSIDDPKVLGRAFEGVEAAFWLTPPVYHPEFAAWAKSTAALAAETAVAAGTRHMVVLSSIGAQHPEGVGPISIVHHVENAFRAALDNVTVLRPAYFMENLLGDLPTILSDGAIYNPIPSDVRFPMVATRDIAGAVAKALTEEGAEGHRIIGVHGPADVTLAEAAQTIGGVLERPVKHVQVELQQLRAALEAKGAPDFVADLFVEMFEGALAGKMVAAEPRSAETTTATDLATFAKEVLLPAAQSAR